MLPVAALFPGALPNLNALISYTPGDVLSLATYTAPAGETYTDVNGVTQTAALNTPKDANYISGVRTLLLGTSDVLTIPWTATPTPCTIYFRVLDQGFTAAAASGDVVLLSIGNGNNRLTLLATSTGYCVNYRVASVDHKATDNTLQGVSGDTLEFRVTLSGAGAISLSHTKNGSAESTAVTLTGATTLGADTFTRANSTSSLGTATTGGAWSTLVTAGGISNNKGYFVSDRAGGNLAWITVASLPDTVSSDLAHNAIQYFALGLLLRYTDSSNFLRVTFQSGTALLESRVGGVTTTRMTSATTLPATGAASFNASAKILSNVVTCYVNGVAVGTPYTLSGAEITAYGSALNVGIAGASPGSASANNTFDNFLATSGSNVVAFPAAWDSANIEIGSLSGGQQAAMAVVSLIIVSGAITLSRSKSANKKALAAGPDTTPAKIVMSPQSLSLTVAGLDGNLTAVVTNAAGSTLSTAVVYTSDTPAVATVNSSTGVVHAVSPGVAVITGTAGTVSDTTPISIVADTNPASVTVAPTTLSLTVGGGDSQLTATVKNAAGTAISPQPPVSYASSNTAVLTITNTQTGLIHPVSAGTATVTVTETTNNHTATSAITVAASGGTNPLPSGPGYSIFSPHWPHQRRAWTDFGFGHENLNDPAVKADMQLVAARMDKIMSGPESNWKQLNPSIYWGPYVLMLRPQIVSAVAGDGGAGGNDPNVSWGGTFASPAGSYATTWAAANGGFDAEELFLHYYDGQRKRNTEKSITGVTATNPAVLTVTAHGYTTGDRVEIGPKFGYQSGQNPDVKGLAFIGIPDGNYIATVIDANTLSIPILATAAVAAGTTIARISNVLGDGTLTYANRKRFINSSGGSQRFYSNWKAAHASAFHAARLTAAFAPADYVFVDEADTGEIGVPFQTNPQDMVSLEYNTRGLNQTATNVVIDGFYTDVCNVMTAVRAANGNKRMQVNTASFANPNDRKMGKFAGAMHHEEAPIGGNASDAWGFLNFILSCMGDGTLCELVDSVFYTDNPPTPTPHAYSTKMARWKSTAYAIYLMIVPQDPSLCYFLDSNGNWTSTQAPFYTKTADVNIGHPTAAPVTTFLSGITINGVAGYASRITTRVFDQGCVALHQPNDRISPNQQGELGLQTVTLPTPPPGGAYYRIMDDGSVQTAPSTTVDLDRLEGAVFLLRIQSTYVASSGNDTTGDGTITAPYLTGAKALSVSPSPGSIVFRSGDTFRETLVITKAGIALSSYGTDTATISGADVITGWAASSFSDTVFTVAMPTRTRMVYVNGTRAALGNSATSLSDGQFIWAANVLYYRSIAGNPDTVPLVVEAAQRDYCIKSNGFTGLAVNNLTVQRAQHTTDGAVYFDGAGTLDKFLVSGCTVRGNYAAGVHVHQDSDSATITNCTVTDNGTHGVYYASTGTAGSTNQTITTNTVTNNGWRAAGSGIIGSVRSGTVSFNTCTANGTTGDASHGISMSADLTPGGALLVHDNTCSSHANGRGIKCTQDATIYNNTVHDNVGGGLSLGQTSGTNNATIVAHHNLVYQNADTGIAAGFSLSGGFYGVNPTTAGTVDATAVLSGGFVGLDTAKPTWFRVTTDVRGVYGLSTAAGISVSKVGGTGTLMFSGYNNTLYHNTPLSSVGELYVESNLAALNWKNNIVYASGTTGADYVNSTVAQTGTVAASNNDYFNGDASTPFQYNGTAMSLATWKAQSFSPEPGTTTITTDPLFIVSGTPAFSLQGTSPCINKGVAVAGITTGFLGTAPDMGFLEKA